MLGRRIRLLLVLLALAAGAPSAVLAQGDESESTSADTSKNGVSDNQILFGQSAALGGETKEVGQQVRLGLEAAFKETPQVYGRTIKLISLDDGYEPEAAIANTRRLIEEDKVFALIGHTGTAPSRSALPVAAAAGVPYIAPVSGAEFLRDAEWTNLLNLRASYYQETEQMVRHLTEDLGMGRISVLYQDDSFGLAGLQGVHLALQKRGMMLSSSTVYPRNTTVIKTALLEIRRASPEAVIIIGSGQPVAETLIWSQLIGFNPVYMTLSFAGGNDLITRVREKNLNLYVTQVVPSPIGNDIPILKTYRAALAAYAPDARPSHLSLEGYLAGRMALAGLEEAGPDLDREGFLKALKTMGKIDLGGFSLFFGDDSQGSDEVFMTVIASGKYGSLADFERDARP